MDAALGDGQDLCTVNKLGSRVDGTGGGRSLEKDNSARSPEAGRRAPGTRPGNAGCFYQTGTGG